MSGGVGNGAAPVVHRCALLLPVVPLAVKAQWCTGRSDRFLDWAVGPLRGRQITPPCWPAAHAAGFASAYDAALSGAIFIAELVYGTLVIRRQFPTCIVG